MTKNQKIKRIYRQIGQRKIQAGNYKDKVSDREERERERGKEKKQN